MLTTVALSFYPSVTSFAADETTEIQESLPAPNPEPPAPEPRIDSPTPPEPTPPEPTPKKPSSDPASWDNANVGGDMNDAATSSEAELLVGISADQLVIKEDIRRNQLETQKAIKDIKLLLFLTNLWLAFRLIITPMVGYLVRKRNGNQEERNLDYSEPSFDPDMMDK